MHGAQPDSGDGGAHTNLADFLLIAAQHEPDRVAIETEAACRTYGQLVHMVAFVQAVLRRALDRCEEVAAAKDRDPGNGEAPAPPAFHRRRPDEHIICIALERGPDCLVAVHATLLEGCAYNTFDVAEPWEKLRAWVEIAHHPVMITSQPVMASLGLLDHGWRIDGEYPRFVIDIHEALRKGEGRAQSPPQPLQRRSDLDRLCYVIFTSGSTGKPKAVMIEHRSACNLARVWSDFVGVLPDDRVAQMASMAFDNHVCEVYGAMHKRCTSVAVPDLTKRSGPDMVSWLARKRVNVMVTVPSHLRSMLGPGTDVSTAALPNLRVLDIGGEALGKDVLDAWAPGRCMFNIYGPTEITVVCAGTRVKSGDEITIGYDLPTYNSRVLDPETLKECPVGTRGVLYTRGVGVARGYLDDEEKTAAKFVQVPGLGRMYCSGDVVSKDEQGRLHYHGRADWQVKVRGVRIELEALEEAVGNLPGVKHCEARVIHNGQKLALLASGAAVSEASVKEAALKLGKGYQLNVVKLVEQSAWKFNTSGKLVRNHVPLENSSQQEASSGDSWEAFSHEGASELELEIAKCVALLVSAVHWSRESHFIEELGLDSAGFGKLVTLLRRKPDLQAVDLPMIFQSPTVMALAAAVESCRRDESLNDSDNESVSASELEEDLLDSLLRRVDGASDSLSAHSLCVQSEGDALTYAQLVGRAQMMQGHLRRALRSCGSRPKGEGRVVLLLLETGPELLVAIVAALLERHAFCVANPGTAKSGVLDLVRAVRPCAIVAGSGAKVELSQQELHSVLAGPCPVVSARSIAPLPGALQTGLRRPHSGSPFFCITASRGAGGQVQALAWEHAAISWASRSWQTHMDLRPADRLVQLFPPDRPECAVAVWAALVAGAALLLPPAGAKPGAGLRTWLRRQRASVLCAAPSQLRVLGAAGGAASLAGLRLAWAAGRQCPGDLAVQWSQNRRFSFAYTGPKVAAACVFEALPDVRIAMGSPLPLGTPFAGCQCLVLDRDLDRVPPGGAGSLYIGCPGLASGGVEEAAGSRERVVELPGGTRALATGFAARWEVSGAIVLVSEAEARAWSAASGRGPAASPSRSPHSLQSTIGLQPGQSLGTILASPCESNFRQGTGTSSLVSFRGYLIHSGPSDGDENPYGKDAAVILCFVVQTAVMVFELLFGAASLVIMERLLAPYMLYGDLWMVVVVIGAASYLLQIARVLAAIGLKWLLIGRYEEGEHAIYSVYYLKHWIVERFAAGSVLGARGSQGGWNFSLGRNLMRVLALKALGADVSLSAFVTAQVTGYDLVSVGPLASVHGPHHLTAVSFVGKRMLVNRVTVGRGATVCHASSVGATAVVADGAFVEPLSTVPSGALATGRWTGVPGRQVGSSRRCAFTGAGEAEKLGPDKAAVFSSDSSSDSSRGDSAAMECRLVLASLGLILLSAVAAPFQSAAVLVTMWVMRYWVHSEDGSDWHDGEELDALPSLMQDHLWYFLFVSMGTALLQVVFRLATPVLVCRLLPKVRAPMDLPLYHWRALLAAIKLYLASAASQELGDASIQAPYLRLLGARVGRGASMSEQTLLPETVTVGKRCFFASGNTLTSVTVDQGRMRVPFKTVIGDCCFLGNENHIAAGVQSNSFVGLRTWVPKLQEEGCGLFGNPAMKFGRPASPEGGKDASICQKAWHHFSTSVIDVFFWRVLHAGFTGVAFVIGRLLFPQYSEEWWPLQFAAEVTIFAMVLLLTWLLVPIGFCNLIYNDRMPLSAPYYSTVITRWFNANKIRRVFKRPFSTAGTFWDASVLRLMGVHVGRRYFSPNQDVMIDPPFGRLDDDVTVDYDGQVRQHSFEDDVLKWGPYRIGSGTSIAQAGMVAMSDCAGGVTLLRGSVTWKGQVLEAGAYEGAPAAPVDEDFKASRV